MCDAILARLVPALVRIKGISVKDTPRPSDALQGWPWIEDTFSWVEPTAFCLLALKRSRRARVAIPRPTRAFRKPRTSC